ncbi:MAG: AraC family transcriptional regulator [Chloroflexota bacterium]|nr:AraC family transcriptional regulator [Chloroflexota bacterium]
MTVPSDSLRRYLDLFVDSLDEDVRGAEIARRAYLSRFHFDRVLRGAIGEPPGTLRRRLLLERAAYRLARSDATATEIAVDAGYESLGAFTRAFGRAFGEPPSAFRGRSPARYWLSAPNGIHFYPPATFVLPRNSRRNPVMDISDRLLAHDIWHIDQLIGHAATLPAEALDATLDLGQVKVDEVSDTTVRGLLDHLVFSMETWTASMTGHAFDEENRETSLPGIRTRLAAIGPELRSVVKGIHDRSEWDAAFIDTQCDPPETFTNGGAIAHVVTFSAYRRGLVIGALRSLGVKDLDYGDPIEWERNASRK